MPEAKRLPNGNIMIPETVRGPNGLLGDRMTEIKPTHPQFKKWDEYLKTQSTGRQKNTTGRTISKKR